MSFFAVFASLLLLSLIFGGLYISRIAAKREEAERQVKTRIRQHKSRQAELEELFTTLCAYDRNPDLLLTIQKLMLKEAELIGRLAPNSADGLDNLDYYKGLSEAIESLGDNANRPDIPGSDRQINIMKRHFARTIKVLRSLADHGDLPELSAHEHIKRLRHNSLILEVDAYKDQGIKAHDNGDLTTAGAYLKHAKDLLLQSDSHFENKTRHIKEISRMIAGLYSSEFHQQTPSDKANPSSTDKG
ncbi:MAG: innate immunity activator family protein [Saccharospirillum sp.]|nr:innate immunity activator family protein [Saccharospirillum sp.]